LSLKVDSRVIIACLLAGAIFFAFLSVPNASSQSSTSTTMTVTQPGAQGQCSILSLPFSAHAGQRITGTFGSNVAINFYILSAADLNGIQNCQLSGSARPIYQSAPQTVGHDNQYQSLAFPADGTYYFVFVYVRGPVEGGTALVELSYPPAVTIMGSTASASISLASTIASATSMSNMPTSTTASTSRPPSSSTSASISTMSTTSPTTQPQPASGFTLFGFEPFTSLLLVIAVVVIVGGALGGGLFLRTRSSATHTLSSYLAKIDSTYNQYAVDREECRIQLEQLKRDAIEMLNERKIEEGHFLMLDEKITEYLKDLTQASGKTERPSGAESSGDNKPTS
jgi:hypothetical protein